MNTMRLMICGMIATGMAAAGLAGCAGSKADRYPIGTKDGIRVNDSRVRFKGHIEKRGGHYLIRSDSGDLYNPENLPSAYRKKGLRVFVYGETEGPRMPGGRPLDIYEISVASQ